MGVCIFSSKIHQAINTIKPSWRGNWHILFANAKILDEIIKQEMKEEIMRALLGITKVELLNSNQSLHEGNQSCQLDKEHWTRTREDYWLPAQADC